MEVVGVVVVEQVTYRCVTHRQLVNGGGGGDGDGDGGGG